MHELEKKTTEELTAWVLEATRILRASRNMPPDLLVPEFGWVWRDGKPTENTEAWAKALRVINSDKA